MSADSSQSGTPHARITAALGYADLNREEAAKALGVSVETVSRLRNGQHPAPESFYRAVVKATGVPMWFLEHGFDGYRVADEDPTLAERLERLERERVPLAEARDELREARRQTDALNEQLRTLQRGIAEAIAQHVEDLVLQQAGELPGASDEAPPADRQEGS